MYHHSTDAGKYEEVCTSIRCTFSKLMPKATHFNMTEGKWVCFPCAQRINADAVSIATKFGGVNTVYTKRPCISSKEYMIKVLMDE